ncbi:HAD-IIA family hydrolase [Candidatus Micrarchaeota archaeon]|nr:HAD-IIA family hydrolase [Candidatus Micrarchaeota archaeon]
MTKAVIFDLDGTLYRGNRAIDGAIGLLSYLEDAGIKTLVLTNAATKSRKGIASKLMDMGFAIKSSQTYPGSYLLAKYISQNYRGKRVYVIGEAGIYEELENEGISIDEENPQIVAVGLDRKFTYEKMSRAHVAITKGAAFIASNPDQTYPVENGSLPGCGAIAASIECASGKKAYYVGKPNPLALEIIKKEHKLKNEDILIVGDRIDTDILFAKNCNVKSALVLSGTAKKEEVKDIKPDMILNSVANLRLDLL